MSHKSNRHRFSEKDCRRIESWARNSNQHGILTLIESRTRLLEFPRPVLLGSSRDRDIYIEGMTTRSGVSSIMRSLDEPFNPRTNLTLTHEHQKQKRNLRAEIHGTMADSLARGTERLCFLNHTGECQRGVIRAHSIQEALIRQIAVNGHVLQFNLFRAPAHEDFRNWPQKVGVDRVSTFTGFCGHHDHEVFRPIEDGTFRPTPQALFLYAYRALCATLYTAKYRFEMVREVTAAVKASGVEVKARQDGDLVANDLNSLEMAEIKVKWDGLLTSGRFDGFDHLVLTCPKTPDILGTMFLAPLKNFQANFSQLTRFYPKLEWLAISVVPRKDGGGLVLISAEKGNVAYPPFIASLLAYPPEKRTMVLVNYLLVYFGEQLILSPSWWNHLSQANREAVLNTWEAGYYTRHLRGICDWGPLIEMTKA